MTIKNSNIVPISFIAGTGGRMVSYLINSARCNIATKIEFSKYGNAHQLWDLNIELCTVTHDPSLPVTNHIEFFKQAYDQLKYKPDFVKNNPLPYYGSCHVDDIDGLLTYFDRAIQITYESKDVRIIPLVLLGKLYVDDQQLANVIEMKDKYWSYYYYLGDNRKNHKPRIDLEPNILNISWQDIYANDPKLLISKLSKFTDTPFNKFKIDDLIEWRNRTSICIKEMSELLNITYDN